MNTEAILFINLGTPDSYEVKDVRRYLGEFLMDPEVIDISALARFILVKGIIVPFRSPKSAKAYRSIWTDEGSPLMVYSLRFMKKLRPLLKDNKVYFANRYGTPSLEQAMSQMKADKIENLHIFPLYPQYATSTWTSIERRWRELLQKNNFKPKMTIQKPFFAHEKYIECLSDSIKEKLKSDHHLIFSFHGIPVRQCVKSAKKQTCQFNHNCCFSAVSKSDNCYRSHCMWAAKLTAAALGLSDDDWSVSFQSRLGRAEWLKPDTTVHIEDLLKKGVRKVSVVCPAFVADCLETVEEIDIALREQFAESGGDSFQLIPCLNEREDWVRTAADISIETDQRVAFS
ncbi:ferrochelatase [Oligoflexaceae bacterium]|nr:ferrochelatase [Oligoflexaceae bacterium]